MHPYVARTLTDAHAAGLRRMGDDHRAAARSRPAPRERWTAALQGLAARVHRPVAPRAVVACCPA